MSDHQMKNIPYLMWGFKQPVDSSNLIYQRDILPEGIVRWSGGLREIGAVEWISVV